MHNQNPRQRDDRRYGSHSSGRFETHPGGRDDRGTHGGYGDPGRFGRPDERSEGRWMGERSEGRWTGERSEGRWAGEHDEDFGQRGSSGYGGYNPSSDRGRDLPRGQERSGHGYEAGEYGGERGAWSDRWNERGGSERGVWNDRLSQDRGRGYGNEERFGQGYGQPHGTGFGPGYGQGYGQGFSPGQNNPAYGRGDRGWGGDDRGYPYGDRGAYSEERSGDRSLGNQMMGGRDLGTQDWSPSGRGYTGDGYGGAYTGGFGGGMGPKRGFVGKGPKGYARSDDRIREEICERLSEGHLDASDIEVQVQGGEVILSGTVSDRRTKRLVEELVDSARGVKDIENRLKLKAEGLRTDTQRTDTQRTDTQKTDPTKSLEGKNGDAQKLEAPKPQTTARA